jgi:enamine deaminase RidA (YjgF/YER057c/UK114 family)
MCRLARSISASEVLIWYSLTARSAARAFGVCCMGGAMKVEDKLARLGLALPNLEDLYRANPSGAHYVSHFPVQNLLYLSGTTPRKNGEPYLPGIVGKDLTLEQGYEAARYATITTLAVVKYALGDLDRVQQVVHMLGFVNSAPGFNDQPRVINGAADLLVKLFGERGKPTRAAIGCQGLGGGASVEIIVTLLFSGSDVRPPLARDHFVN